MSAPSGYYLMHRGWMDNPALSGRSDPFCKRAAWAWLIEEAAWSGRVANGGGWAIPLSRGELSHSVRFLAHAWGWSVASTTRYLNRLVTGTMIGTRVEHGQMVITICNYDKYQVQLDGQESPCGTASGTGAVQERYRSGTNENTGKEKKERKIQETTSPAQASPPLPPLGLDLLGNPPAKSARDIMWADGLPILKFVTGKSDSGCRSLLGKMLRETKNDCSRVMSILHEAQSMHPLGQAEAWLMEAARGRDRRLREPVSRLDGLMEFQDALEGRGPGPGFDIDLTAEEIT